MYFLKNYLKNMIFGIKSAIVWKQNLIEFNTIYNKTLKIETKSYGDEATDFHDREIPKVGSH